MSHRKSISSRIIYSIALAGILVGIVLAVKASRDNQNLYVMVSLFGSMASLSALVIAIIHSVSIKRISEATNEAVEETKNQIFHAILLSEVSAASPLIDLVEVNTRHDEYDPARLRLGVIKSLLIKCNANGELRSIEDCGPLRIEIETHISNLQHDTSGPKKKKFKPSDLNETLSRLKTILKIYEIELLGLSTPPR